MNRKKEEVIRCINALNKDAEKKNGFLIFTQKQKTVLDKFCWIWLNILIQY